jgi:hypothetical protein
MRKLLVVFAVLAVVAAPAAAVFEENVGVGDSAEAQVDRPLMNHVKVLLHDFAPPLYEMVEKDGQSTNSTNSTAEE